MKLKFYVAEKVDHAINFIKVNTDWIQRSSVCFQNEDEKIIVVSDFMKIRGRKFDGVYIDYSFNKVRGFGDFQNRFKHLEIKPVLIKEIER